MYGYGQVFHFKTLYVAAAADDDGGGGGDGG